MMSSRVTRIQLAAIATILLVAAAWRPGQCHDDLDAHVAMPWNSAGAESLQVSILGQFQVTSSTGIHGVAAYVHPDTGAEYGLLAADSLYVIDLADPAMPRRTGAFPMLGVSQPDRNSYLSVKVRGIYAYAAERYGPIGILDLSDPESPVRVGEIPESDFCACSHAELVGGRPVCHPEAFPEVHRIFIDERGVLYVAGILYGEGTHMYDVTGPNATDPEWLCHEHTRPDGTVGFYDHDVFAAGGLLYTSKSRGNRWEILAGYLSGDPDSLLCPSSPGICGENPNHPRLLSWFPQDSVLAENTHAHSAWRDPNSSYLLTADELEHGHIRIWDLTPVLGTMSPRVGAREDLRVGARDDRRVGARDDRRADLGETPRAGMREASRLGVHDPSSVGAAHLPVAEVLKPPTFAAAFKPDDTCHSVHDPYVVPDPTTGVSICYAAWYNKGIQVFVLGTDGTPTRVAYYEHPLRWHEHDGLCCDPTRDESEGGGNCFGVPFLDFLPDGRFVASEIGNGLLVGRLLLDLTGVAGDGEEVEEIGGLRTFGLPGSDVRRIVWFRRGGASENTISHGSRLDIYSAGGTLVSRLEPYSVEAQRVEFRWQGRDLRGRELASGVYFARIRGAAEHAGRSGRSVGSNSPTTRVVVLR